MEKMKNFAVVDFYTERTSDGKLVIAVVPKEWMKWNNGNWSTYWPSKVAKKQLVEWQSSGKSPKNDWSHHTEIEILTWADNFMSAERRCDRARTQRENLNSSGMENTPRSTVKVVSRNTARDSMEATESSDSNERASTSETKVFEVINDTRIQ
ncbi:uncharacterized protein [Fopius arisanus]|uniref:Uncharacterized protein n=1 Tax=Fopius arisanus TaxID=64838 RepID=A0A9R1T462_9HYME|nr:PREDICTED: uncharacterized protein LOC105266015 [Fopius arisanus]